MEFESQPLSIDPDKVASRLHPNNARDTYLLFLSLWIPPGETHLIATLKEILRIDGGSDKAKAIAKALISQEGRHTKAHKEFNDAFEKKTGQDLSFYKKMIGLGLKYIPFRKDKTKNIAMVILSEVIGNKIGKLLLESPLFDDIHGEAARLFHWHFSEEVLHADDFMSFLSATNYQLNSLTKIHACLKLLILLAAMSLLALIYARRNSYLSVGFFVDIFHFMFVKEKMFFIVCYSIFTFLTNRSIDTPKNLTKHCMSYLDNMPTS